MRLEKSQSHELFFPSFKAYPFQQQAFASLFWQFWTERVPKCRNTFPRLEKQSVSLFHHVFLWWFLVFIRMTSSPESSWTGIRLAQFWVASALPCPGQTCSQGLRVDPFQGRWRRRGDKLQQPGTNDRKNCCLFSVNLLPRSWGCDLRHQDNPKRECWLMGTCGQLVRKCCANPVHCLWES